MKNNIIKNYFLNIIIMFFNILFPIIVFPYASRILLPENYGKYDFAISFVSYFSVCANLGIQNYAVKELIHAKLEGEKILKNRFSELIKISLISSSIVSVIYIFTIFKLEVTRQEIYIFLLAGIQVYTAFMSIDYFFIAQEKHTRRALRIIIIKVTSLILMIMFIKKPEDYLKFMSIIIIPQLILKCFDLYSVRHFISFKSVYIKKHLKGILTLFIYTLSAVIYANFDLTIIGIVLGNQSVGLYSMGIKITRIIIPLITSLGIVLAPKLIKEIKSNQVENIQKTSTLYFDFLFLVTLPIVTILYFVSEKIITLIGGENYVESSKILVIALPLIILSSLNDFITIRILIPSKKEVFITISALLGIGINILFNIIYIKKSGIHAVAKIMVFSEMLIFLLRYLYIKNIYPKYTIFSKDIIRYIVIIIIIIISNIYILKQKMSFIAEIGFIVVVYLLGIILLKDRFSKEIIKKYKNREVKQSNS